MSKRILKVQQADGSCLNLEHEADVSSYVLSYEGNRLVSYASQTAKLYVWDMNTATLLNTYRAEDYFLVSKDGQWLIIRELIDYGNGQEEFFYMFYIGQEGKISDPSQFEVLQSWVCYAIDLWIAKDGTLWTDGEYNNEASKPGHYIYDCSQYCLSHDGEGCAQLEQLQAFPSPNDVVEPEDNGFLVEQVL